MENVNTVTHISLQPAPPSSCIKLTLEGKAVLYVDFNSFITTYTEYYTVMAPASEQEVFRELVSGTQEGIVDLDARIPNTSPEKEQWTQLLIECAAHSPAAIQEMQIQAYAPEMVKTVTGVMEDYRTGHGKVVYALPSGVVLLEMTWIG